MTSSRVAIIGFAIRFYSLSLLALASLALAAEPPSAPASPISAASATPLVAPAPLQFLAVTTLGPSSNLFALGDTGPNGQPRSLGWKKIGDTVAGLRLLRYDESADALFLQDAFGTTLKLVLKSAQTATTAALTPLTREEARAYLAALVELNERKYRERYPDQAILDFDAVQQAPPQLQADYATARQFAKEHNLITLLARRADGTFVGSTGPREPIESLPAHVRANLTEADWLEHEIALETVTFRARETRKQNEKNNLNRP